MCRYARPYKPHYACFACRKSFKRRLSEDVGHVGADKPARCPQCGVLMADMGWDFKPPKSKNIKAWSVLEGLWSIGETFHSCGCGGPGYRPREPRAYRAFLEMRRTEFKLNLQRAISESNEEGTTVWRARLSAVETALASAA